jgi:hypothetical protein
MSSTPPVAATEIKTTERALALRQRKRCAYHALSYVSGKVASLPQRSLTSLWPTR